MLDLGEFFNEYFIRPIMDPSVQGYNIVNTLVFGAILIFAAFYIIHPLLNKKGVKFDAKFALALLPFILFGSSLRVLTDLGVFPKTPNPFEFGFWTFTPGVWVLTALITIASLLAAKKISGKTGKDFYVLFAAIGLLFSLPITIYEFFVFRQWPGFFYVLLLLAAVVALAYFIANSLKKNFFSEKLNLLAVSGQALDGSATYIATQVFSCGEQHPLSEAILGMRPEFFIIIKVALAILVLHYVDKEVKEKNLNGFIKVFLIIIGFAPGVRDLLTLGIGTCG